MTVIVIDRSTKRLRGVLSRYMLEIRAGLFVGRLDARMRELLWEKAEQLRGKRTSGAMIWRTNNAQGFELATFGSDRRTPILYDGLKVIGELPQTAS